MDTIKITGQDTIFIFALLARYVEDTDKLDMFEEKAYVLLPQFLSNSAAAKLWVIQAVSPYSGATCWSEAVQYLHKTYATPSAIRDAC